MDGIKQQVRARQEESLEKKHTYEMKKARRQMRSELDKMTTKNKAAVSDVKNNYDRKILDKKNELEIKLTGIRKKNDEILKMEEEKFTKLVADVKSSHVYKMNELEESQNKEVEKQQDEHRTYMESAQNKFKTEKAKFEA